MVRILAVTEYYNEEDNISGLVDNVMAQSLVPECWILIDDGSTDNSSLVFMSKVQEYGLRYSIYRTEPKDKPTPNLKGVAWKNILELNTDYWIEKHPYDFLLKIDADTLLPRDYISRAAQIMMDDSTIGCFAAQIIGETIRKMPCGTGKLVRWNIIQSTRGKYWDLDPDTLWNIKAHLNGYKLIIGDASFSMTVTRPTQIFNPQGRYRMGQRMAYVRCSTFLVGFRYLRSLKAKTHSWQFLKGYLREWLRLRDRWRSNDDDIQYFYNLKHRLDIRRGKIRRP